MFEIPQGKRVRREELYSPASSTRSSPDPELTSIFLSTVAQKFQTSTANELAQNDIFPVYDPVQEEEEQQQQSFSFNLFAPRADGVNESQVRLRSLTPDLEQAGFLGRGRSQSYYFTGERTESDTIKFAAAALSGEAVRLQAKIPCPGLELPWRVIYLDGRTGKVQPGLSEIVKGHHQRSMMSVEEQIPPVEEAVISQKRRKVRKGKKSRIARRKVILARRTKAEEKEQQERLAREKKTKKNREKKSKKRARDKAKAMLQEPQDGEGGSKTDTQDRSLQGNLAEDMSE